MVIALVDFSSKHDPNIDAIITIDSLLAAGVCDYIAKHQLDVPVLSFDSVNPKLNLAAYVDINSLELGSCFLWNYSPDHQMMLKAINKFVIASWLPTKLSKSKNQLELVFLVTNYLFQRIVQNMEHFSDYRDKGTLDPPVS